MHVLSEVDTVRLANIIVNEVGIIEDDSKKRILDALDVFIRGKIGDFNRVSKLLDDTLLAYKELLQQQKELCTTVANLRNHSKQVLTQNSLIVNKLNELENHVKGLNEKVSIFLKQEVKETEVEPKQELEEKTYNDENVVEIDSNEDEAIVEDVEEDTEPPEFVKDLIQKLEQEEQREESESECVSCSKLTKEEAKKKMRDVLTASETKVVVDGDKDLTTDNVKDITDPLLIQLTFLELIDICKYLSIEIPKRCKYNDILKIISNCIKNEEEIVEVIANATGRKVEVR